MGVQREVLQAGNGNDKPKSGDMVTIEYTGNLHDDEAPNRKGKQCVISSLLHLSHWLVAPPVDSDFSYSDLILPLVAETFRPRSAWGKSSVVSDRRSIPLGY